MQLTEGNIKGLAHRFVEILGTLNTVPPAFAILDKEKKVYATRFIRNRITHYRIQIEEAEICELEAADFKAGGKYYHNRINEFTGFFLKGCENFIVGTIKTEVGKILDTVRDPLFRSARFFGSIDVSLHVVEMDGWNEKFIDIHCQDELQYSAPFHYTNEEMLGNELYRLVDNAIGRGAVIVQVP